MNKTNVLIVWVFFFKRAPLTRLVSESIQQWTQKWTPGKEDKSVYLATLHRPCDVPELVVQCASGSCRHHIWLNVNLALKSVSRFIRGYKVNSNIKLSLFSSFDFS